MIRIMAVAACLTASMLGCGGNKTTKPTTPKQTDLAAVQGGGGITGDSKTIVGG